MKLRATGQTLELVESERLVSGSVEIYTAAFEFDPAWDGYAKTAVFTDDMGSGSLRVHCPQTHLSLQAPQNMSSY